MIRLHKFPDQILNPPDIVHCKKTIALGLPVTIAVTVLFTAQNQVARTIRMFCTLDIQYVSS